LGAITLLGADNKAGVSLKSWTLHHLMTHPEVKHGKNQDIITPDEEIGRGVDKVDIDS
jgi:tripeptide aminopeptidase